jgi:putative oxidoreductase
MMSQSVQDALNLAARLLVVALFLPAGIGKLTGFDGTVAYIASVGLPLPAVGAALAAHGAGRWSLDGRRG